MILSYSLVNCTVSIGSLRHMTKERLPLWQIARFPEESPLEGVPTKTYQSALLAQEVGIPPQIFELIASHLTQFETLFNLDKRRLLQQEKVGNLLADPSGVTTYLGALNNLQKSLPEIKPEIATITSYYEFMLNNIEDYAKSAGNYNPLSLQQWLHLYVAKNQWKQMATRVLRGFYRHPKTPKETVDFLYTFSSAILQTHDPEIFFQGLPIMMWHTDIFPKDGKFYLSSQNKTIHLDRMKQFAIAGIYAGDDELIIKQDEIEDFIFSLAAKERLYDTLSNSMKFIINLVRNDDEIQRLVLQNQKRYPDQTSRFQRYFQEKRHYGHKGNPVEKEFILRHILLPPGELRRLLNQRLELDYGKKVKLALPHKEEEVNFDEYLPLIIQQALNDTSNKNPCIEKNEAVRTLFYLSPHFSETEMRRFTHQAITLTRELKSFNIATIIGKNYQLKIDDKQLQDIGIERIIFEPDIKREKIKLIIPIGFYQFIFQLNKDMQFEDIDNNPLVLPFLRSAFIKTLILNNLKLIAR